MELVAAIGMSRPHLLERAELREVAERILGRLRHRHLARQEPPVALARVDPESFRRLLGEETRGLGVRQAAEEKARGETDGARDRGDEVREVAEPGEVAPPAL